MGIVKRISLEEREYISNLLSQGKGVRQIARELKRSPSTISEELRRFNLGKAEYKAFSAQEHALLMKRKAGRKKKIDGLLIPILQILINDRHYSPEQVSGFLKRNYPNIKELSVSHETIYQFIYNHPKGIHFTLRRKKKARRKRGSKLGRRSKIPNRISIHNRPKEVDFRQIIGHWEGDLIIGKNNRTAIGTLVERVTRFMMVVWLDGKRDAATFLEAFSKRLESLPSYIKLSLTYDNGSEACKHELLTARCGMPVYFADPGCPWQRGSNENANGLLRQYLPKSIDLQSYTEDDLSRIENLINNRPRKILDYATPAELMRGMITSGISVLGEYLQRQEAQIYRVSRG
jgi:transposase, IS30 family